MNPYSSYVDTYARLAAEGKLLPMGGISSSRKNSPPPDAPKALIFSPHPDDECIIGALPLRLLKESGFNVINVAVTQGSKKERQSARFAELREACAFMGYGLIQTKEGGLEKIGPGTRTKDPQHWNGCVNVATQILQRENPRVIFFPHEQDWNSTHIGTHHLVMDALKELGRFNCHLVETEYWGAMTAPNLMIESSPEDVAEMVAGTSFHVGEVTRNPFHILLPAWMQDNVRRGSELVGGQGEAAPNFIFATLYRARRWAQGQIQEVAGKKQLGVRENPGVLFAP